MVFLILFALVAIAVICFKFDDIFYYKIISINDTDLILTKGPFHRKQFHYKKHPSEPQSRPIPGENVFKLKWYGWFAENGGQPDSQKLYDALDNLQKVLNLEINIKELWSKK